MFESIEFVPDQFHEFLMDTVGFSSYKTLKVPEGHKGNWWMGINDFILSNPLQSQTGFERPLTIYTK